MVKYKDLNVDTKVGMQKRVRWGMETVGWKVGGLALYDGLFIYGVDWFCRYIRRTNHLDPLISLFRKCQINFRFTEFSANSISTFD